MKHHTLPSTPPAADTARVVELFRALAEPIRLRLVLHLSQGECNVSELVEVLNLPQSTVSRHLATLRAAKLVRCERRGTRSFYQLADAHLHALLLEAFSHVEHERLQLADHPSKMSAGVGT
ncbi:MAG: metalloregulator ArsR/SmtB family transcription factor [Deinococcota bacterium]